MNITELLSDMIRMNDGRKVSIELKAEAYAPPATEYRARICVERANGSWDYFEASSLVMAAISARAALHKPEQSEQAREFDNAAHHIAKHNQKEVAA